MSCKTIAIAHEKGGVGKTTTTLNLGIGLAHEGKRVLLVDVDSQGNLTKCLGLDPEDSLTDSLATALLDMPGVVNRFGGDNILPGRNCIHVHHEGVDFIPADKSLSVLDQVLVSVTAREQVLSRFLQQFRSDYDYILLDCKPSLSLMVVNALTAADGVLVPVQTEDLSVGGLDSLLDSVSLIRRNVNPGLSIEGIIFTMTDRRTKISQQAMDNVRKRYQGEVSIYDTTIPRNASLGRLSSQGKSIFTLAPRSTGAQAYRALTLEVLSHEQ